MSEPTRTTGLAVRRRLLSVTVMVAVAVASGCVLPDGEVGSSISVSALSPSPVGSLVPTMTLAPTMALVQPPPFVAPTDRPAAPVADEPVSDTSTAEPETVEPEVAAPMTAAAPVGLRIPSIGVDSDLVTLGLQDDGTLEVPTSGFPAGWYTGAPTPGELGPAIIAGHVDWGGQPGVFFDLRELSSGDEIAVTREDGSTAVFRVTRVERFDKGDFPTDAVYGDLDHAGLRLITCGGDFDPRARSYVDNLVVFAELI